MQFLFGDRTLDIDRRELRHGSQRIAVEPQVFDLLAYLVQNRERVVSKDDLLDAVWSGRFVSESTLTSRITRTCPVSVSTSTSAPVPPIIQNGVTFADWPVFASGGA